MALGAENSDLSCVHARKTKKVDKLAEKVGELGQTNTPYYQSPTFRIEGVCIISGAGKTGDRGTVDESRQSERCGRRKSNKAARNYFEKKFRIVTAECVESGRNRLNWQSALPLPVSRCLLA